MTPAIYTRLPLTEPEFKLLRNTVSTARQVAFERWSNAIDPNERIFYAALVDQYDDVLAKCDQVLIDDHSQDADPDEPDWR